MTPPPRTLDVDLALDDGRHVAKLATFTARHDRTAVYTTHLDADLAATVRHVTLWVPAGCETHTVIQLTIGDDLHPGG